MNKYKVSREVADAKSKKFGQFWETRTSEDKESQYDELLKGGKGKMKRQHELTGQLEKLERAQKSLQANPIAEKADSHQEKE